MKTTSTRICWDRPWAFVESLAFLLFLALAFSHTLVAHAPTVTVALAACSGVILWRMLGRRRGDPPVAMGQTAALLRRGRRWMLGESDRNDG